MEQNIPFNKDRGIKGCMADGWKIVALNWKNYLKTLLPYLLFAGVCHAFLIEMCLQYVCEQAYPAWLLGSSLGDWQTAKLVAIPTWCNGIYLTLALLLTIFANLCLTARTFHIMKHYRLHDAMPTNKDIPLMLSREDWQCIKRILLTAICGLVASLIVTGLFVGISSVSGLLIGMVMKWNIWSILLILLPLTILQIFITSATTLSLFKYTWAEESFKQSWRYAMEHAFGLPFILMLLACIPITILCFMLGLPEWLFEGCRLAATKSMLAGDSFGLPAYITFIFFIIISLCATMAYLVKTYFAWVVGLKVK